MSKFGEFDHRIYIFMEGGLISGISSSIEKLDIIIVDHDLLEDNIIDPEDLLEYNKNIDQYLSDLETKDIIDNY